MPSTKAEGDDPEPTQKSERIKHTMHVNYVSDIDVIMHDVIDDNVELIVPK